MNRLKNLMQDESVPGFVDPEKRSAKQETEAMFRGATPESVDVESVKWVKRHRNRRDSALVNVAKSGVFLPAFITDDLGPRIGIGTGFFKGRLVLLVKTDPSGYLHGGQKRGFKRSVVNKGLMESLLRAGAVEGYYRPIKITGGWMCQWEERS